VDNGSESSTRVAWDKLQPCSRFSNFGCADNPEENGSSFAIVGSGNLTHGGQQENIECGAYICEESTIRELDTWFSELDRRELDREILNSYAAEHASAKRFRKRMESPKTSISKKLRDAKKVKAQAAPIWNESLFTSDFVSFMKLENAQAELAERIEGAQAIRQALHMPRFDLDELDWKEFYKNRQFGSIRMAYPKIAEDIGKLRRILRGLIAQPLSLQFLESVLHSHGELHIRGLGTNLVSKVLTVHNRERWPLFNDRVMTTLGKYGYEAQWGAAGYLQCAQDLRNCLARTGRMDFWALDVFCENKSR